MGVFSWLTGSRAALPGVARESAAALRERLLGAPFVSRLQIERMLLDVLDDVFLLNLALETPEGALDGLAFLNLDLSHAE